LPDDGGDEHAGQTACQVDDEEAGDLVEGVPLVGGDEEAGHRAATFRNAECRGSSNTLTVVVFYSFCTTTLNVEPMTAVRFADNGSSAMLICHSVCPAVSWRFRVT